MPKTREELDAARAQVRAENSARAKRAAATRAARKSADGGPGERKPELDERVHIGGKHGRGRSPKISTRISTPHFRMGWHWGRQDRMRLASRARAAASCRAAAPAPPSCIAIAMRSMQPLLPFTTVQKMCITYTVGRAQARFSRIKSTSKKRTPSIVNLTVKRRYLTEHEVERLMDCARKHGRYGPRDATMILVAHRHGLPASV